MYFYYFAAGFLFVRLFLCNGALSYSEAVCVVFRVTLLAVTDRFSTDACLVTSACVLQLACRIYYIYMQNKCMFFWFSCPLSELSGFVHGGNLKPGCITSVSCTETTWNILSYEGFFSFFFFQLWVTHASKPHGHTHTCFHLPLFLRNKGCEL